MQNKNFLQQRYITSYGKDESIFVGYTGKLLKYAVNTDNKQFGQFNQTKLQKRFEFTNQQFSLAQLFNEDDGFSYFIGVKNEQIQIGQLLINDNSYKKNYEYIPINIQAQQLQGALNNYQVFIIGLSDNDTIQLYQYQQQTFYNPFITPPQMTNFTALLINNEKMINKLFYTDNKLKFNPIQIAINTQQLCQCLFINNINNVIIILSIFQNNTLISNSIIDVKFQIKYINIVNQQLMLSYICNQGLDLCFQVWTDTLFFMFNFKLNYLYLQSFITLTSKLILQTQFIIEIDLHCLMVYIIFLYFENQINSLLRKKSCKLQVNQSQKFERSYPQMIYNYTVNTLLNLTTQFNQIKQIMKINFLIIISKTKITKNFLMQDLNLTDRTFIITMVIILDRQASLCYFPNRSDIDNLDQSDLLHFSNNVCIIAHQQLQQIINFLFCKTTMCSKLSISVLHFFNLKIILN
ncbi:unnamed protein product [Paramecium pentaurelia]|uniref:Uncharacterized protein n=1 Tax=Paramecium pentaurelia TaxID=43138 RepID=A0A8S1VJR5_9CILI|nr:unnamed protein product [Paramecium pentaurelia]